MLIIGMMSGTSLDGVDAALVEIEGSGVEEMRWQVVHSSSAPYSEERRRRIHDGILAGTAEALCALHADLGEWLAEGALRVCEEAGIEPGRVAAIGSHGQTVWHIPPEEGRRGSTLQLGDPATLAERTGCAVISDFRARDMAAGGHGAPLVPWVDQLLFAHPERARVLQNIGGIANLTWVPRRGSGAGGGGGGTFAFDTGPGNSLMDAAVEIVTGGSRTYDEGGRLAAQGEVMPELLEELIAHPYFSQAPPKSTGREVFGRPFVERLIAAMQLEGDRDWLDLIATLTELTARTIADAYGRWVIPRGVDEVFLTGGGVRNPMLVERIRALLDPLPVRDGSELGIDPDVKEAVAFAVLAWAHLRGIPANVPAATGAAGPRVLGSYTPGAARPVEIHSSAADLS